ncbi:MAG: glycosyltransferase family 4 protein [Candidatus Thorarchaeota archaeon]
MKITFVASHLTIYGGGGKFLLDYANILCENGHNITIIAQKINNEMYRFSKNISLIEVGGPLPSNPLFWFEFNKIKRRYLKVINQLECDIFVSLHFPTGYFCSKMDKRKKVKVLYFCLEPYRYFHDKRYYSSAPFFMRIISIFLRIFFKKFDIIGAKSADKMICISKFTRMRAKKWYGKESIVHYIGIEVDDKNHINNSFDLRKDLMLKRNTPIIFTLGLTANLKGAKELLYIFNKILKKKSETILLIGGKISKGNEKIIKKIIKKLKIPNRNVILYGFIDDKILNSIYAQSTLTYYTAIDESFGLIPLESMKNGTPVIAFEGGPSETIIDGKTGYIIKTNDLKDFAKKTLILIEEEDLCEQFSESGINHVRENFNLAKTVSSLENILINILKE